MTKSSDLINRKRNLELKIRELEATIENYEKQINSNESLLAKGGYLAPLQSSNIKQLREEIADYKDKIKSTKTALTTAKKEYGEVKQEMRKGSR